MECTFCRNLVKPDGGQKSGARTAAVHVCQARDTVAGVVHHGVRHAAQASPCEATAKAKTQNPGGISRFRSLRQRSIRQQGLLPARLASDAATAGRSWNAFARARIYAPTERPGEQASL